MHQSVAQRFAGIIVAMTLGLGSGTASANNIPGSANSAVPELTEIATGMVVRSIKESMRPLRAADGSSDVTLSSSGRVTGFGAGAGGEMPVSLKFELRDLDTDRLDGSLATGTLLLGHAVDDRLLVFGGLLVERLDTDTVYNEGHIDADGLGLAVGMDYRVNQAFYLTGIVGVMDLDYDVSRNAGAVTGSFGARRGFVDLSGDYLAKAGNADILLGFGLLYVSQKNDGYTESGGDVVDGFTNDQLSGKLSARSTWGQSGALRPYVDAETWFRLSGSSGLPSVLDPGDEGDWSARLGVGLQQVTVTSGFDLGLGSNFGDDGFEGLDAKLRYTLRF